MYIAKAVLQEIKKVDDIVYFSVLPPIKMTKRQERRFCRVELSRTGVLVANGTNGGSTTYLSKTINLSGGGVLINNIEKMSSPDFVEIDPSLYDNYYVIIFLEQDLVLKLPARYIRTERVNGNYRYAFQFVRINEKFRDVICKYVTNEQIRQLKLQNRYK
jgi:c-di-GMP-binding flagellar brake protein YcgR